MSFYPSHGYQGTEDTWYEISKPELSLEMKITTGHVIRKFVQTFLTAVTVRNAHYFQKLIQMSD